MPIMPQYRSPYGQSIMELLAGQGDAAARAAQRSGMLWGNAVSNIGQIGAQAYEQRAEQKDQQKRGAIFDEALSTWDGQDLPGLYRKLAIGVGPEEARRQISAISAIYGVQQGKEPTEGDLKVAVAGVNSARKTYGDEYMAQNWGSKFAPGLAIFSKKFGLPEPPPEYSKEVGDYFGEFETRLGGAKASGAPDRVEQNGVFYERSPETGAWAQAQGLPAQVAEVKPDTSSLGVRIANAEAAGNTAEVERLLALQGRIAAAGRAPATPAAGTDPETVSAYVDDLAAGAKIWSDVPANIRNAVQVAARAAGVNAPTKRPTEKVLGELSDGANLVARTAELLNSPTGVMEWAKANGIPDWMTQLTGWGAASKANRSEFFMYMAETLKAIQGSRPSDKDMEWYMANLPRQGEAPQSAQLKIDKIKARLVNQYNTRLTSLRRNGYALPGLELLSGEGQYLAPEEEPAGGAARGAGTSGNPYVFE